MWKAIRDLFNPPSFAELQAEQKRRQEQLEANRRRFTTYQYQTTTAPGLFLGQQVSSANTKPFQPDSGVQLTNSGVSLDPTILESHMAVIGSNGTGKTVLLVRLMQEIFEKTNWDVFLFDGKGDEGLANAFSALAYKYNRGNPPRFRMGKNARGYPFNAFSGDKEEIRNQLIALARVGDLDTNGETVFHGINYRNVIDFLVDAPEGPPKSFQEVLRRANHKWFDDTYGKSTDPIIKAMLGTLKTRLKSGFSPIQSYGNQMYSTVKECGEIVAEDGFTLGQVRAGSFCVNLAGVPYVGRYFTDFILASFLGYTGRMTRPTALIIDEFGVLGGANMGHLLATARQAGLKILFTAQSFAMLGDALTQQVILENCHTHIYFKQLFPEGASNISGTVKQPEMTIGLEEGTASGRNSFRYQDQFAILPNEVRGLPRGQGFIYKDGGSVRVQVKKVDDIPIAPAEERYTPRSQQAVGVTQPLNHPIP